MNEEASSEPVATAFRTRPSATFMAAYFSAAIPERQTPEEVATSQGDAASSPCTINPCPGRSWSGDEVPQERHSMSPGENPGYGFSARTASAVSRAFVCVARPVAGSMA
jgi:hypothetical protein